MQLHIRKLTGWMNLAICLLLTLSVRVASQETPPKGTSLHSSEIALMAMGGPVLVADTIQKLSSLEGTDSTELKTISEAEERALAYTSLHPKAISFVKSYESENREHLEKMKPWADSRFRTIESVFSKYKIPAALKYLAVVESELKSTARSPVGAVGPWQLMPETARLLGLKVNNKIDERKNLLKSTTAAAKYLRDLYKQLNDWFLVIAAYNSGPARVESAIKQMKSRDFWVIQKKLPAESRNHVKKFIAVHFIMEGPGDLIVYTPKKVKEKRISVTPKELAELRELSIKGKFRASVVAANLEMEKAAFDRFNPEFDKVVLSETYTLRLPADKMDLFTSHREKILEQSVAELLSGSNNNQGNYPEQVALPDKAMRPSNPSASR